MLLKYRYLHSMGVNLNLRRKNRDTCILNEYICISDRDISICSLIQISLLEIEISMFKIQISLLELDRNKDICI